MYGSSLELHRMEVNVKKFESSVENVCHFFNLKEDINEMVMRTQDI